MIHVVMGPGKTGRIEVDGIDIAKHVVTVAFERSEMGAQRLNLGLVLDSGDVLDLQIPEDDVEVTAHLRPAALKHLRAGHVR